MKDGGLAFIAIGNNIVALACSSMPSGSQLVNESPRKEEERKRAIGLLGEVERDALSPGKIVRNVRLFVILFVRNFGRVCSQEPRKGSFSKGGFYGAQRHAPGNKNSQGYWAQQYIWHSDLHSQRGVHFYKKNLVETPFSSFLIFAILA